jgi:superkiller protein 3
MRKYIPHILIISFIFLLVPTAHVATYAGEIELIESCREYVREFPDDYMAHFALGGAYYEAERYKEAIHAWKRSIKLNPDYAPAYFYLGLSNDRIYKHKVARKCYQKAIRIDPDYAVAHYNLGLGYLLAGDGDSAMEQYKILKNLDSELANELFNYIYRE